MVQISPLGLGTVKTCLPKGTGINRSLGQERVRDVLQVYFVGLREKKNG